MAETIASPGSWNSGNHKPNAEPERQYVDSEGTLPGGVIGGEQPANENDTAPQLPPAGHESVVGAGGVVGGEQEVPHATEPLSPMPQEQPIVNNGVIGGEYTQPPTLGGAERPETQDETPSQVSGMPEEVAVPKFVGPTGAIETPPSESVDRK